MKLNFRKPERKGEESELSIAEDRNIAEEIVKKSKEGYFERNQVHLPADAFMLLIKKVDPEMDNIDEEILYNLCEKIENFYGLNKGEGYKLTQGDFSILKNVPPTIIKMTIYNLAIECLKEGKHLGRVVNQYGNTSAWISHSLHEAELAGNIAKILGLDSNKARTLALLHDYGRKEIHSFEHTTRGFSKLVSMGWKDEAVATLTHSFLNGGRCANCDPAEEGFYLDEEGKPQWKDEENKDEVAKFLDGYRYSSYDEILNIADLMATADGIVSPDKRIEDIRSRKPADSKNEGYFLSEFINKLSEFLGKMGVKEELPKADSKMDINSLKSMFNNVSEIFYREYQNREKDVR